MTHVDKCLQTDQTAHSQTSWVIPRQNLRKEI